MPGLAAAPAHVPALRMGCAYRSLDISTVIPLGGDEPVASMSVVNGGIVRRDIQRCVAGSATALRACTMAELIEKCARAGELFMTGSLPFGEEGSEQSPDDYVRLLSSTSGLPHVLVRRNMEKIAYVLTHMREILQGLTRGLDHRVLDEGIGEQGGARVAFYPTTEALGVVLPSNSPGVNSIWLPAIALKIPVVLKPGRDEPWTPWRIIQAFIAAGVPREAFGFYPTDHEGAATILRECGRGIIFGDDKTLARYRDDHRIECHGTGFSKVLLGEDVADDWEKYLDIMIDSIAANGGRSCINASLIVTPRHGRAVAEAVAKRLAMIEPREPEDPEARLSAFANPAMADYIDSAIEAGLAEAGAIDLTATHRNGPRRVEVDGRTYLRPTVIWAERWDHPLVNREFLMPFVTVVELPESSYFEKIGPTLVATLISENPALREAAMRCAQIDRLNLGAIPTSVVEWDQPHEGNLFEFLYRRRAISVG